MRLELLLLSLVAGASACSFLAPSDDDLMGGGSLAGQGSEGGSGASGNTTGGSAPSGGSTSSAAGRGSSGSPSSGEPEGGAPATDPGPSQGGDGPAPSGDGPGSTSTADLLLWLRADVGVVEEGVSVATWEDASGQGNDAGQTLVGARPTLYRASATALPMVAFDGSDDYLMLPDGFGDFSAGLSFFAAVQELSPTQCPSILQISSGSEIADIDFGLDSIRSEQSCVGLGCPKRSEGSSGGNSRTVHYEVAELFLPGPAGVFSPAATNIVGVVHRPDSSFELRVNGSILPATMALPKVADRVSNFVGRTLYTSCQPFRGRIGEIVLFARALPDAERDKLETYFRDRWQ